MDTQGIIELNEENFDEEVFEADSPILVEFVSEASYACREAAGVLEALAAEYAGRARIGRIDMDACWQTAQSLGVHAAPTALLVQHGRVVDRIRGLQTREQYRQALNELVARYWEI